MNFCEADSPGERRFRRSGPDETITDMQPRNTGEQGTVDRGGRPAVTSAHEIAAQAQRLFLAQGFENTSVGDIAEAAGVSRRTFFRYFATKADVVWVESDAELAHFRAALAAADPDEPPHITITNAFIAALDHGDAETEWARHRAELIITMPAVQAQVSVVYRQWRAVIAEFVAGHRAAPADDVYPAAVAHAVIAASAAGHELWLSHPGTALADCLRRTFAIMVPRADAR